MFRVTRDADVEVEVDEADDLLGALEPAARHAAARPRRSGSRSTRSMPRGAALAAPARAATCAAADVYVIDGPARPRRPAGRSPSSTAALKPKPWIGVTPPRSSARRRRAAATSSRCSARGDVLVQHPYDRFATSVEAFVDQAADDPRRARDQADALPDVRRARPDRRSRSSAPPESGKQVVALVELTGARRRGGQHRLGADAREGGRPRRLRRRRAEDPRQDRARRPRGGRGASAATATSAPATTTRRPPRVYEDVGPALGRPRARRPTSPTSSTT